MTWDMSKVVGHNARVRRTEMGIDVPSFGSAMEQALGRPWKRQTVSAMENGERAMTANDLVAIAHVLQTTPSHLLVPPIEAKAVHVGDLIVGRDLLVGMPASLAGASDKTLDLLRDLMDEVREAWGAVGRAQAILNEDVTERLKSIDDRITAHVSGQAKGNDDGEGD